jgi:mannose-6-phosphate isomerase-like protein (cupin superfamily)
MKPPLRVLHVGEGEGDGVVHLGPYEIETLIPGADEGAGTAYRVRIAPGQRTNVSYHRVAEEFYLVIRGRGIAVLDGVEHELRTGDFLRLPPGTTHGFITGGDELVMLDIHTPGSRPDRDVYFVGDAPAGFGAPAPADPAG